MPRDVDVLRRLRKFGLNVTEVAGWQTRGNENFNPRGSCNHHTAGARTGNAPSLGACINGRGEPNPVPGPLSNTLQARDNTIFLIAAGRANHAGAGSWQGLSGNSTVWGHEIENVGTNAEPWRPDQRETAARVHAAFLDGIPADQRVLTCQHYEWTTRKIDAHDWPGAPFRQRVSGLLVPVAPGLPPTYYPEDDVTGVPIKVTLDADGRGWTNRKADGSPLIADKRLLIGVEFNSQDPQSQGYGRFPDHGSRQEDKLTKLVFVDGTPKATYDAIAWFAGKVG